VALGALVRLRGTAGAGLAALALWGGAEGAADPSLKRRLDAVLDRPAFAPAFWGAAVRDLRTGRVLYERSAGKNFKPASTLKLVATAAALDALGPDARLLTTVETAGRLDGLGRVLGDVFLVGRGDPNLSGRFEPGGPTAILERLADQLRAAGVRRIEGRLVGHEGAFTGERRGEDWTWEDLVWGYGAEVSALSFNDNAVHLRLLAGEREGDPALVEAAPPSSYYRLESTARTGPTGAESTLVLRREAGNLIRLSGAYPLGKEPWEGRVALEDPAAYAATVFREVLLARGIPVTGGTATSSDPRPAGARVLASHQSKPLAEIVKVVNKESQNLHAEVLLRLVGAKAGGAGSAEAGHAAALEFLRRQGVMADSWAVQDGSGLSRSDLVSPGELVGLLAAMDRHPHAQAFRDSLAVAGVDGTLKNRLRGTPAEGRILAKTGTLRHVAALAGYVVRQDGQRWAFAVIANHHTNPSREAVAAIDEVCRVLVGR
jgi:D-alanyl-D-alanine carboxypeptidase/D-alanyl-D-alanine-endopeptidase (penicillin-binding protein 4)